ncbi:hypothetical protein OS493_021400 [Desmophyllum pertusum]|uniref:Uncharacterized protein n=1 Tax=Desmophyllum pertusum TaxID=174260 RepID=A0A9W9Z0B1_9CNID|nr:hypothetical protein OS493_021400 [Desmophyllum pertusum]
MVLVPARTGHDWWCGADNEKYFRRLFWNRAPIGHDCGAELTMGSTFEDGSGPELGLAMTGGAELTVSVRTFEDRAGIGLTDGAFISEATVGLTPLKDSDGVDGAISFAETGVRVISVELKGRTLKHVLADGAVISLYI